MSREFLSKLSECIREEEIFDLIKDLVAIPSYNSIKNQETEVANYIYELFKKEDIVADLTHVQDGRNNITAILRGKGNGKSLLLTGHLDTVPPYDMEDAFEVKTDGDKIIGRGTNDMKGPLACMIMTLVVIKRSGLELEGDLIFAAVIDEEERSLGTIDLIEKGIQADGAIVGEPSNLEICIAHRGVEWIQFDFEGKTVHGGAQDEGINAILRASNFIQKAEKNLIPKLSLRKHRVTGTSTMNYGTINGGTQPSTVAGSCTLKIDRRWIPGERYEDVLDEYREILNELAVEDPQFKCNMKALGISTVKAGYVHESMEIDENHILVESLVRSSKEVHNKIPKKTYFSAWSDGGLLHTYAKIPTLIFAPGDLKTAHSRDEFINMSELVPAVKIYALTAYYFCRS
ncbi:MAG TPA: acetylornithine deacetylase [Clostridiales bacterium]|nr:acetylornithine deacetylase [Clostridiales bacterium]